VTKKGQRGEKVRREKKTYKSVLALRRRGKTGNTKVKFYKRDLLVSPLLDGVFQKVSPHVEPIHSTPVPRKCSLEGHLELTQALSYMTNLWKQRLCLQSKSFISLANHSQFLSFNPV
jgi:hypothetical protein